MSNYTDDCFDRYREDQLRTAIDFERSFRIICAWCKGVLQDGGAGLSHGICRVCKEKLEASV